MAVEFPALTTIGRKERSEEFSKPLTTLVRSLEGGKGRDGAVTACSEEADRAETLGWGRYRELLPDGKGCCEPTAPPGFGRSYRHSLYLLSII